MLKIINRDPKQIVVTLTPAKEGGYVVEGYCDFNSTFVTEGDTLEEALHNVNDAYAALKEGEPSTDVQPG